MNKPLFWTGIIAQAIHLFVVVGLLTVFMDWSFINFKIVLGVFYVIFNIATLIMIFMGALKKNGN